ncbi:MAG: hypothetical protein JWN03_6001 [Nocardia sp.]|uniref:hypothetical protein n=1 Tax=Nocardia sp. TaxID=1821 RepID=UPI002626B9D9|nr:hypothetical protein [Nocardia sp.]MCU1645726.1 hypothetical protein [Nocardia sp.]
MFSSNSRRHPRRRGLRAILVAAITVMLSISLSGQAGAVTPAQFVAANESSHSKQMEWWYVTGHLKGTGPDGKEGGDQPRPAVLLLQ